jgi:hypothetical protein
MNQPTDSSKTSPSLNSPLIAPAASASGIRPRDAIEIANSGSNNAKLRFNRITPNNCDISNSRIHELLNYYILLYSANFGIEAYNFRKMSFQYGKNQFRIKVSIYQFLGILYFEKAISHTAFR